MVQIGNCTLYHGDCLEVMPTLAEKSIDAVIADIPYGTTQCKWDTVIPFEAMWINLKRLSKLKSAIVLFGSQPFTSALVMSNVKMFKYSWVWNKRLAGNGILAKVQPLKIHEDIHVFSNSSAVYYPQKTKGKYRAKMGIKDVHGTFNAATSVVTHNDDYYPTSILEYSGAGMRNTRVHPTQKPVALMEYLIKTYTNEGETVLDFTMGSGTTGVAAINTGRHFIGIEKDDKYFDIAVERMRVAQDKEHGESKAV